MRIKEIRYFAEDYYVCECLWGESFANFLINKLLA